MCYKGRSASRFGNSSREYREPGYGALVRMRTLPEPKAKQTMNETTIALEDASDP